LFEDKKFIELPREFTIELKMAGKPRKEEFPAFTNSQGIAIVNEFETYEFQH